MHINVVGLGIKGCSQLTLEALEIMRCSPSVLVLAGKSIVDGLAALGVASRSILSLYENGGVDVENYRRIVDAVIAEARVKGDVTLVLPGHPRVGVTLASWLARELPEAGIGLTFVPGISSFDTMMIDLNRDPLERGSSVLDVNRLLIFDLAIEPSVDLYLYHVCSIGNSRTDYLEPTARNQVSLLQEKLLGTYPADHQAILVGSSEKQGGEVVLLKGTVGDLQGLLSRVSFSTTLFIPSVRPRNVNRRVLELIQAPKRDVRNA